MKLQLQLFTATSEIRDTAAIETFVWGEKKQVWH